MRRVLVAVVALAAAVTAPIHASGGDCTTTTPERQVVASISSEALDLTPTPSPRVSADAWYLLGEDGVILAQHDAAERRPIASITKLMTAVVTLEHASPSELVTVASEVTRVGGSTAFLRAGERLTVADLLRAMLVPSANDAAIALAVHVGRGSTDRFVARMNDKARELELGDTTFTNPHGLDEPGHLSSARDVTLLVKYALGVPFIRDALSRTAFALSGGRFLRSTDDLYALWAPLIGGKTGHTDDAGWSEAAAARARGATVYGAVLGSETRGQRNVALKALLTYGLQQYRRIEAVDGARVYALAETGYGQPAVELVAARPVVRTVRRRAPLVERVVAPVSVGLPVREGQRLGSVEIYDQNRRLVSASLVARCSVAEPGVLAKVGWYVQTTATNLWEIVT